LIAIVLILEGKFMKLILILMMMLSSFAHAELVQNDFFTKKADVKNASPGCAKIGTEKVKLKSKDKFKEKLFWCVACKDGSIESESAKFRFFWKDAEGDTDINKVHHSCAKVEKDSKFFYCDAESKKVKKVKAKNESEASAAVGGANIYTTKSDAKKDEACIKVKDSKFFYCDAQSKKVKKIKAKDEAEASAAVGGANIYTSKSDAKKDEACIKVKDSKFFYCDPETLKVKTVKAKNEFEAHAAVGGANVYTSKSGAKSDAACQKIKLEKIKAFYCDAATKKVKKVKGKFASEEEAREKLGLEDVKFYNDKKAAKQDPACDKPKVVKVKFFYCDPSTKKVEKVKGKFLDEGDARAKLNLGNVMFYDDKKEAKNDPACSNVKEPASLSCYICDPSTGNAVEINREFAEGNDQKQLWDKLVANETRCESIKRKNLKKIFTKPAYLSVERLFNDADKYYSKGAGAKLAGKKLFKKVDKAPLFSSKEAAMDAYKAVGTHEINKCVPAGVVTREVICGGKYETKELMEADQSACVSAGNIWDPSSCSCVKKVELVDCTKVKSELAKVNCSTSMNKDFSSITSIEDLKSKISAARDSWIACYKDSPVSKFMSEPILSESAMSGEVSFNAGAINCEVKKFTGRFDVKEFDLVFPSGSYKWDSRFDYFSDCKSKVEANLKNIDKNIKNVKTTIGKKGYITINYIGGVCTVTARKNWWSNSNKGSSEYCKYNPKTGQASCSATGE
jgi:hypothetical protein